MDSNKIQETIDKNGPLKQDFRNFLYVVWMFLGLPEPTKAQYRMAYFLQHGPPRSILAAFRGIGKSYITVAYCAWRLYCNPELKIMVVSAGEDRAKEFSMFLRTLIRDMPLLQHLQAKDGQRDSVFIFDVGPASPSGSPSVKSVGITGQLTGSRADIIISDDCEIPRNSQTHDQREKLSTLVKEFAAILKPDGKILYLGTPQTELSLYNVLETRGYTMRIYPARYPNQGQIAAYGGRLDPEILIDLEERGAIVGTSTDPMRFSDEDLLERELEYGRSGFALQFMLDTSLSDGNRMPLKVSDLIVAECRGKNVPNMFRWSNSPLNKFQQLPNVALAGQYYYSPETLLNASGEALTMNVLCIDPSGRGSDETSGTVMGWSNGNLFWRKTVGLAGGYSDEVLETLANLAKEYKVNSIVIESNFGDGMFTKLLTPIMNRIYPCKIEEIRHNTQKELRIIETLEPIMNQHRLIVDPLVIQEDYDTAMRMYPPDKAREYMVMYQLSRITKDRGSLKHDDRLESVAMAANYFAKMMVLDQQRAAQKRNDELLDKEVKAYKDFIGKSKDDKGLKGVSRWNARLGR